MKALRLFIVLFSLAGFGLTACGGTQSASEQAAEAQTLEVESRAALTTLTADDQAAAALADQASGILVFPSITEGGFIVGVESGEGVLFVDDVAVDRYSTTSASIGLQAGIQSYSQVLMFMSDEALAGFRDGSGWEAGVDGTITVIEAGAGGSVDTNNLTNPIVGFVFGQQGLMGGISLEGSKYSKVE